MELLSSTSYVRGSYRLVIGVLVAVVFMTSNHVQFASASGDSAEKKTIQAQSNDTVTKRGIRILETAMKTKTSAVAMNTEAPAKKKRVWNTVNAPDLETKPAHSSEPAKRTMRVATTAYTSDPRETDSTPFTTANGSQVRDGIIAANFLPFGTRVRIPDHFGDKVFEVHDRMNARYTQRVDIWMLTKKDAKQWGVRNVKIEILP